ncbi:hypothetical protein S245_017976 [Arachis hypogaea]
MRSTLLVSPLSESHSATLLLPLIELPHSLTSLFLASERTHRRTQRRELDRSLEEAPKQPSLVAVPQSPATAAIRIATASAQRRPCSPRVRLLFGQPLFSPFWPTLVLPFLANPCSSCLALCSVLYAACSSLCSTAFQPPFSHCSASVQPFPSPFKAPPFPVLLEFQNCSILG